MKISQHRRPIAPGEVLREDYIEPLGMTQGAFADALDVDRTTVNEIVNGRRSVTPEMALRLARVLSTTPQYWLNLQRAVDLYDAEHSPVATEVSYLKVLF